MSSSILKILACIFMLIDHIGFCLLSGLPILRIIGRLAFPIFAFQIAVGFKHTSNRKKYFLRMLIFALVSQIPFFIFRDVAGYSGIALNIGFTFVLSIISLYFVELAKKKNILFALLTIPVLILASYLNVDYKWYGIAVVITFYLFDLKSAFGFVSTFILLLALSLVHVYTSNASAIQLYSLFSLILLMFYNNKKGYDLRYLFYAFYPVHLLILSLIKYIM